MTCSTVKLWAIAATEANSRKKEQNLSAFTWSPGISFSEILHDTRRGPPRQDSRRTKSTQRGSQDESSLSGAISGRSARPPRCASMSNPAWRAAAVPPGPFCATAPAIGTPTTVAATRIAVRRYMTTVFRRSFDFELDCQLCTAGYGLPTSEGWSGPARAGPRPLFGSNCQFTLPYTEREVVLP